MSIKYGKRIVSENFYAGQITKSLVELESQKFTDKDHLLKDIIDGLIVITSGQTNDLTFRIQIDKQKRYKLTQRYVAQQG